MDTTILSAIITSIATLAAAFITVKAAKKSENPNDGVSSKNNSEYSIFNKTYTILTRKRDNRIIALKDGFSWPAFFFSLAWLIYNKLWDVTLSTLLFITAFYAHFYLIDRISGSDYLEHYNNLILWLTPYTPLILGTFGNRILTRKYTHSYYLLSNNTFTPVNSVVATTKNNAILKHMKETKSNG